MGLPQALLGDMQVQTQMTFMPYLKRNNKMKFSTNFTQITFLLTICIMMILMLHKQWSGLLLKKHHFVMEKSWSLMEVMNSQQQTTLRTIKTSSSLKNQNFESEQEVLCQQQSHCMISRCLEETKIILT